MAKQRRNIMRAFKMHEISGVDSPAQKGALVTIMKRDDGQDGAVEKRAALTTAVNGHSHLVMLTCGPGDLDANPSGMTSYVEDHAHPWVMLPDGTIQIGEAMGHTHGIAEMGVSGYDAQALLTAATAKNDTTKEAEMADAKEVNKKEVTATVEDLAKRLGETEAQLAAATLMAGMTDVEKAHYATLDEAGKAAFGKMDAAARKGVVDAVEKNRKDENPVVYTATDGAEYRKSDDPRLVQMAKDRDADRKDLAKRAAKEALDGFTKRAEEDLKYLPGTVEVRTAIVKAISTDIKDEETQKAAFEALKAHNAKMAPAFTTVGVSGGRSADELGKSDAQAAEDELDALAKKAASEDKTDYFTAYAKVSAANPDILKRAV